MIKLDIISGFLGAGKTTLIKKLLEEAFNREKLALIENEFGEIGIDGTILKDYGIEIKEMNSGCICCTIAGDFNMALKEIIRLYHPDRIMIEPSGVGKLSDVIKGCKPFINDNRIELNMCITVIDGMKYKMYIKNFAEFYKDQLMNAKTILLSRTQFMQPDAIEYIIKDIRKYNLSASVVTTEWEQLSGAKIVKLAEDTEAAKLENNIFRDLQYTKSVIRGSKLVQNSKINVDIQSEHHHADDVFSVWSRETVKIYNLLKLKELIKGLDHIKGSVLRAKGIVKVENNGWVQFDYVPGECSVRETKPNYIGRICIIGDKINEQELSELFGLSI